MAVFDTDPTVEDARQTNAYAGQHPAAEVPQLPVLPGDDRLARRAASEIGNAPSGLNPVHQHLNVVASVPFLGLLPMRLLHAAAALIGLLSVALLPVSRRLGREARNGIAAAAAMGVSLHGILAITAIVEIGFYRYLVPCWPLVCTLPVVAAIAVRRAAATHRLVGQESQFPARPLGAPT
jgi:hypothetical protein